MSAREKILDDLAKMAGGTVSVFSGLSAEIRQEIRSHIDELALKMDLVPRADFERVETLLNTTRLEQDALIKRLETLEKQVQEKPNKKA